MNKNRFFLDEPDPNWAMNGDPWSTTRTLNTDLLDRLRRGAIGELEDFDAGTGLVELVQHELTSYGTDGSQELTNDEIALAIKAMRAVLTRLQVTVELPFHSFDRFRSYWISRGASGAGGWQARRDLLDELFDPVIAALAALEQRRAEALAEPVSPRGKTGWTAVDVEIHELRRRFRDSTTPQDYRAVGTHCVGVIEALSATVYNPARHLRPGETEPPVDKSKLRLDRYIEDAVPGPDNEELRGLAKRAIGLAHQVKHRSSVGRRDAGIAADATILLANILRRLADN